MYGFFLQDDLYIYQKLKVDPNYGLVDLIELDLSCRLYHKYLHRPLNFISSYTLTNSNPHLILPIYDYSLDSYIKHKNLSTREKLPIFYKICCAIKYLHSQSYIYYNLHPDNIYISGSNPILTNYSIMSKSSNIYPKERTELTAPEINKVLSSAVDIWDLGILFIFILSENMPSNEPINFDLIDENYRADCIDLLNKMMEMDPNKRITSEQILAHNLFREIRNYHHDGYYNISWQDPFVKEFTNEIRECMKIMVYWCQKLYPDKTMEILFLSLHLFARYSYYLQEKDFYGKIYISSACLLISSKLLKFKFDKEKIISLLNEYYDKVNYDNILLEELAIITNLQGILSINSYYDLCTNANELLISLNTIYLSKDMTMFVRTVPSNWATQLKEMYEGQNILDKNLTIQQLLV